MGKKNRIGSKRPKVNARKMGEPGKVPGKGSDNKEHPLFGFKYLDRDYCISNCEKSEKVALIETLRKLGSLTWGQIRNSGRHQTGYEQINIESLRGAVPSHVTRDTLVIAFRFDGKKPMIGYKDGKVFEILKIDRNFTAYKH